MLWLPRLDLSIISFFSLKVHQDANGRDKRGHDDIS
jgi:hypothetical protein